MFLVMMSKYTYVHRKTKKMKIMHSNRYIWQHNTKRRPTVFTVYSVSFYFFTYFFSKLGHRQILRLPGEDVLLDVSQDHHVNSNVAGTCMFQNIKRIMKKPNMHTSW